MSGTPGSRRRRSAVVGWVEGVQGSRRQGNLPDEEALVFERTPDASDGLPVCDGGGGGRNAASPVPSGSSQQPVRPTASAFPVRTGTRRALPREAARRYDC